MNIESGDIDNDDDNDEIFEEEDDASGKAGQRGESQPAGATQISSQDPVIINR